MPLVPLREWIRSAEAFLSREDYVTRAVSLASGLVNHLLAADASRSEDLGRHPRPRREDLTPENVLVAAWSMDPFSNRDSEVILRPSHCQALTPFDCLSQRDLCFAFGKILFELFARGDPLPSICRGPCSREDNQDVLFSDLLLSSIHFDEEDETDSRPSKRSSLSAEPNSSPTMSIAAKRHLRSIDLPLSICQLVSDLLEAEEGNEYIPDTALTSLEEARLDLTRMRENPQCFLFDQKCPRQALEHASLYNSNDDKLYGREQEMRLLTDAAGRVARHGDIAKITGTPGDFLCEAVFLAGRSGSGKSSVLKGLLSTCDTSAWSVLHCKFDRQLAPLSTFLQSVDAFFLQFQHGRKGALPVAPQLRATWDRISHSFVHSVDSESFVQLSVLFPNFGALFPMTKTYTEQRLGSDGLVADGASTSSIGEMGGVGSGSSRLNHLLGLVFAALGSGGRPVALVLDDLQWADSTTLGVMGEIVQSGGYKGATRGALLYVGSFRDNEVEEDGVLQRHIAHLAQSPIHITVTRIAIGTLSEAGVNEMLSFKLCLPPRYTRPLAEIVHRKTRGVAIYVIEFLCSIVRQNMVTFSVKDKRWTWNDVGIDMQVMSEGVVGLLTEKVRLKSLACLRFLCEVAIKRVLPTCWELS